MGTTAEIALRFALGGIAVSVFSALGEIFQPKTFAGMFGAAPSVALATLGLAFADHGAAYAADECRSMMIGGVGLVVYTTACAALITRRLIPVWLAAGAA